MKMNIPESCCLCSQIEGDPLGDLIAQLLPDEEYVRRVPVETDNFAVIPSLGALVPGHMLICPKQHIRSFGVLSSELWQEFLWLKDTMASILADRYDAPVHFFEHGSRNIGHKIVCTVDHAHLHCLPGHVDVWPALTEFQWKWVPIARLSDIGSVQGKYEYLYYESPQGVAGLCSALSHEGFPSQILRRVFAQLLNCEERWNWRVIPAADCADMAFHSLVNSVAHSPLHENAY